MGGFVLTVVGARPNLVKLAPLSRALRARTREVLVHTGQHWEPALSADLFAALDLPRPDHHLGVGAASPATQTARMLEGIERLLLGERPRAVVVYGDTHSTLAGALAAAKLAIPVAHVEAGLRSFVRAQPEEQNRVLVDRMSRWLLAPTDTAVGNLAAEGLREGVHRVGDVMLDAARVFLPAARLPDGPGLSPRGFYYLTAHRAENVDRREPLAEILAAAAALDRPVVFPVHPRTRDRLAEFGLSPKGPILATGPVGYLESLALVRDARAVLTDSGGLVREAFFLGTPCVTLRDVTEWPETLLGERNLLGGARRETIRDAVARLAEPVSDPDTTPFGDGHAAERIAALLCE
jgi:UDP-GlcNAc3NAcA epimerase